MKILNPVTNHKVVGRFQKPYPWVLFSCGPGVFRERLCDEIARLSAGSCDLRGKNNYVVFAYGLVAVPRLKNKDRFVAVAEVKFDPDIDFVFNPVDNDDLPKVNRIRLLREVWVGAQDRVFNCSNRLLKVFAFFVGRFARCRRSRWFFVSSRESLAIELLLAVAIVAVIRHGQPPSRSRACSGFARQSGLIGGRITLDNEIKDVSAKMLTIPHLQTPWLTRLDPKALHGLLG